ncbi:hypothetical protein QE152_g13129 [Popillia japonica]|uniref:Uncharacterized protein n=1 Tax=Popillia japonica TaxID=7064 RepID=A0AAW1LEU1_POPJA
MDPPTTDAISQKPTAIPRLNKRSSVDSALSCNNDDSQAETPLSRSSSDPNQHPGKSSDKTKNIGKFTLKDKAVGCKNDDANIACGHNNETDDEINSTIFTGKHDESTSKNEEVKLDKDRQDNNESVSMFVNENAISLNTTCTSLDSTEDSSLNSDRTVIPSFQENSCQTIPPPPPQPPQNISDEKQVLKKKLRETSLKESYLQQTELSRTRSRWNAINPLYKNIALRRDSKFRARLISDINVSNLTKKDESSDIDTDDEACFESPADIDTDDEACFESPAQTNLGLYKLYKSLSKNKEKDEDPNQGLDKKRESLVNAFLEVFENDSHIIQKLKNNSVVKNSSDQFKKLKRDNKKDFKVDFSTIQEHINMEINKAKVVQDIYKNDDVLSILTQSSNENWSRPCTPRRDDNSKVSPLKSGSCGCEMKHLQYNDLQKSITDIRNGMKLILANFSPTANEDIALELTRLRSLYNECLTHQRKVMAQNRKLQADVNNLCFTIYKIMDKQKSGSIFKSRSSGSIFKYLVLPLLGVLTYFVVTHYDIREKIPVSYYEYE